MSYRVATGIDVLDRKLAGGLPPGTIVAYTARPASQSELLLYELTAARRTLYLSTQRSAEAVSHAMERTAAPVGTPRIRWLDDEALAEAGELVEALPADANLIVDTMDVLERSDRAEYTAFLNRLKERLVETGSIAVLHCPKADSPPRRARRRSTSPTPSSTSGWPSTRPNSRPTSRSRSSGAGARPPRTSSSSSPRGSRSTRAGTSRSGPWPRGRVSPSSPGNTNP